METEAQYVDSSFVLRRLYRIGGATPFEPGAVLTSSELVRVELSLAIDRRLLTGDIDRSAAEQLRADGERLLSAVHLFPVSDEVLARAAEPFPLVVSLRSAVHVATAQVVRAEVPRVRFWTTGQVDAAAAAARQLEVAGLVPEA